MSKKAEEEGHGSYFRILYISTSGELPSKGSGNSFPQYRSLYVTRGRKGRSEVSLPTDEVGISVSARKGLLFRTAAPDVN